MFKVTDHFRPGCIVENTLAVMCDYLGLGDYIPSQGPYRNRRPRFLQYHKEPLEE